MADTESGQPAARARTVIVVGAGLAGISTAWILSRRGFQVALVERDARVGGRAAAVREEGFSLDALPPVLSASDRRLLAWVGDVGLRDDALPLRSLVTEWVHDGEAREVEVRSWLDVRRVPGVGLRQALRLVRLPRLLRRYGAAIDPDHPERAADLDDRSLADFGRLYFGPSVFERWMAPLASDALGDPYEMSRVQFLHTLRRQRDARPGLLRLSLADVAERAAEELGARTGIEVASVSQRDGEGPKVQLADGRRVSADAVVLAVSAPDALRLCEPELAPAERDGLASVEYAPGLTLAAGLCRPPVARPVRLLVPEEEESPIASAILEPGLPSSRVPEGLGLAVLRATPRYAAERRDAPLEAVAKELLGAFEALRPGVQRSVELTRVLRLPRAAPRFDVGRYREIARFLRVQRDRRARGRRVYFAGDYLVHPSFEGALVSAERAAAAVQADLA